MTRVDVRHYAKVSHGRILVGVQIQRTGPGFQAKLLYDEESSLSLDEARRAVKVAMCLNGHFGSEDGRFNIWCAEYKKNCLEWLSMDGERMCEDFRLGTDYWSAEFLKAIEDAILEAEEGE